MKKYVLHAILIFLVLSTIATATQVNEKLGPYSINFSTPANIYTKSEITNSETYSGAKYQTYNLSMLDKKTKKLVGSIDIEHWDTPVATENSAIRYAIQSKFPTIQIDFYMREIDNMDGMLGEMDLNPHSISMWYYALNSQNIVVGYSFMPWDNDTSEILDTLHVDVIRN
jgi:hypothetical protein